MWSQCHSLAFDFSVWEIFGALLRGGRLVVVPEAVARSPEDLHAVLVAEQVSVLARPRRGFMRCKPPMRSHRSGKQLKLETVVFGGEALEPSVLGRGWTSIRVTAADQYVWHHRDDGACLVPRDPAADAEGTVSPIGVPLAHLGFFVLDGWLRAVPAGVVGELYVAGAGVGVGMWAGRV